MHPSLKFVEHRPWALPAGPWVMAQNWEDLLFAHWPVVVEKMRELVPRELEIDTFEGRAWVGVVPFRMSGVRLRRAPATPGLSAFLELNVRTYVTAGGRPGVWFFSLDAANRIAVEVARRWFHLPYFYARMTARKNGRQVIYSSQRNDRRGSGKRLTARYEPLGERFHAKPGTLDYFLTERYCLYAQRPDGTLLRGEIHHAQWSLQAAAAEFDENTIAREFGVELRGIPLLHFSKLQEVVVWAPRVVLPSCVLPFVKNKKGSEDEA
jgi:uncharacterized protein YqjF (DUF2071 family)